MCSQTPQPYLTGGVKRVVVSAPVKEPSVLNVVMGVNDDQLTAAHTICTAASCTTNCLAPVVKVRNLLIQRADRKLPVPPCCERRLIYKFRVNLALFKAFPLGEAPRSKLDGHQSHSPNQSHSCHVLANRGASERIGKCLRFSFHIVPSYRLPMILVLRHVRPCLSPK